MGFTTKFEKKTQKNKKKLQRVFSRENLFNKWTNTSWISNFILKSVIKLSKTIKIKRKNKIPKRENNRKIRISNPTKSYIMIWSIGFKKGKVAKRDQNQIKQDFKNH